MPRNYEKGRLVYVTIEGYSNLKYTFKTRVKNSTSTDLGHTNVGVNQISTAQGYVIGANAPKPPRATKRTETGMEGSFVDKGSIGSARDSGYKIKRGKNRVPRSTQFTTIKYITINGIKYAWNSPKSNQEPASLGSLGVKEATSSDIVVFGANFPKPPKLAFELDNGSTFSSFVDPSNFETAVQAGWVPVTPGKFTAEDLKGMA